MSAKQKAIEAYNKSVENNTLEQEKKIREILAKRFPNAVYNGGVRAWYDDVFIEFKFKYPDRELIWFNGWNNCIVLSEADVGQYILADKEIKSVEKEHDTEKLVYSPTKKQNCFHFLLKMFR